MKVIWSEIARGHLDMIEEYLGRGSAAERVTAGILSRVRQLELFPESGRRVPEFGDADIRDVVERPYRIIYEVADENVFILAVLHGREQLSG